MTTLAEAISQVEMGNIIRREARKAIARARTLTADDFDDLVQEGHLRVLEKAHLFVAGKHLPGAFVTMQARYAMADWRSAETCTALSYTEYARKRKVADARATEHLPAKPTEAMAFADLLEDFLPAPDDTQATALERIDLAKVQGWLASHCDDRQRDCLLAKFVGEQGTMTRVAKSYNISLERVRQIATKAMARLRASLQLPQDQSCNHPVAVQDTADRQIFT